MRKKKNFTVMFTLYKAWESFTLASYSVTVYVGKMIVNPTLEQVKSVVIRKTSTWELVP